MSFRHARTDPGHLDSTVDGAIIVKVSSKAGPSPQCRLMKDLAGCNACATAPPAGPPACYTLACYTDRTGFWNRESQHLRRTASAAGPLSFLHSCRGRARRRKEARAPATGPTDLFELLFPSPLANAGGRKGEDPETSGSAADPSIERCAIRTSRSRHSALCSSLDGVS